MMSRRSTFPSLSSSRQMMMAWKVSGLSHRPAIIASRPASMRLAIAISPSRDSSSTEPISRIHAHGIIGAADVVAVDIAANLALAVLGLGLGRLFAFLAFDDVDAELGEHRHRVFDLFGRHLVLRQRGI